LTHHRLAGIEPLKLQLMLALTFSTGVVDAVGYLGLDRVFTGNMTGNVVLLGMALTGTTNLPILRPVLALLFFFAGATVSGRVLRRHAGPWTPQVTGLLWVVAGVLAAVAILLAVAGQSPHGAIGTIATSALGLGMGMQAALARRLQVADVTTVVVTSTLTGLAADSWWAGGSSALWRRRAGAIALIMAGAGVGALALLIHVSVGVGVSAAITAVVAVLGHRGHRRHGAPSAAVEVTL
jgi:uncharacterized membrane protein YoaK (UPF0700 family)